MGSDLKSGAGKLAGYLVLKRVSENLPLLILSNLNCTVCLVPSLLLSALPHPPSRVGLWVGAGGKQEQSCKRG